MTLYKIDEMRKAFTVIICLISLTAWGDSIPWRASGDSVTAGFFREWYHRSDLVYYLEAYNDHTIAEMSTYGQWWLPDRLMIGIEGLPFTINRYYVDGMRTDDLFQPGSTRYVPNMQHYDWRLNTVTGQMYFTSRRDSCSDYVLAMYNSGQLGDGEPMAGTTEIFNISHRSPMQSADTYKHVSARRHLRGAGQVEAAYTFKDKQGNAYPQHVYAAYGQRLLTREDVSGLITDDPFYRSDYYKVQADGVFPVKDLHLGYKMNFSGKEDGGSEFLYNYGEVYDHKNYSGMVYLKREWLTTGLNWSTDAVHHNNREFSKNILDQDGESFFPWVPDGKTHALSWAVNYKQPVLPWLNVHVDAYNSMVHFSPEVEHFSNTIYFQKPIDYQNSTFAAPYAPRTLYRYQWTSQRFTGGLLENTIGVDAHYSLCKEVDMQAHLDLTLDGMLLRNKSKMSANWQAGVRFDIHPCKWFDMKVELSHERLPYTIDYLRYFSDDYLNGTIEQYDGTSFSTKDVQTTGGKYHHYQKGLQQTSFAQLDIPLHFRFGRHEITLQQSYRRYFNVWFTRYMGGADANGTYMTQDGIEVFYPSAGTKEYEVGTTDNFGPNWLLNAPYYVSQLTRYSYYGKKVLFSLSWQSMQAGGYSALGNGPNSNTVGVLSETTANPNTQNVVTNQAGQYRCIGTQDLDKGFVCRIYLGYNICKWVQAGVTMKWTDGKPFTDWKYYEKDGELAILPYDSRGTNPTDGHFGKRNCAKYNIDLHVQGQWTAGSVPMKLNVECYNMWDFCHDLAELCFVQDIPYARRVSMIMDVPVGLLTTLTVGL